MAYEDVVLADSPRIYWTLKQTSGTVATDLGSAGINGTYAGTYTQAGTALPDGTNALRITGAAGTNKVSATFASRDPSAVTFEVWVRPYNLVDYNVAINNWDDNGIIASGAMGEIYAGEFYNSRKGWNSAEFNGTKRDFFRVGQWTHVVYTHDGTTARLYRNGTLVSALTGVSIQPATEYGLYTGDVAYAHFAQWDSAITPAQVRSHYDAMVSPPTDKPIFIGASGRQHGGTGGDNYVELPPGVQEGDLAILLTYEDNGYSTIPPGWTSDWSGTAGSYEVRYISGPLLAEHISSNRIISADNGDMDTSASLVAVYRNATIVQAATASAVTSADGQDALYLSAWGYTSAKRNKTASNNWDWIWGDTTDSGVHQLAERKPNLASGVTVDTSGFDGNSNLTHAVYVIGYAGPPTPPPTGTPRSSVPMPFTVDPVDPHPQDHDVFTLAVSGVPESEHPSDADVFTVTQDTSLRPFPLRYHPKDSTAFTLLLDPALVPPGQEPGSAKWGFPIVDSVLPSPPFAVPDEGIDQLPPARYASNDSIGVPNTSPTDPLADAAQLPKILPLSDGRALIIHTQTANTTASNYTGNVEERVYAQFATPVPGGGAPTVTDPVLVLALDDLWPGEEVTPNYYAHLKPTLFAEDMVLIEYHGSTFSPTAYMTVRVLIDISGADPVVENVTVVEPRRTSGRPAFSIGNNKAIFIEEFSGPWREQWTIEEWDGSAWSVLATFNPSLTTFQPDYAGDLCYDPSTARGLITTDWSGFPDNGTPEYWGGSVSPFTVDEATNTITFGIATGLGLGYENSDYAGVTVAGPGVFAVHAYLNNNDTSWHTGDIPLNIVSVEVNADATIGNCTLRLQTELVKDDNWYPVTNLTSPPYSITYGWSGDSRRWIALGNVEQDVWGLWCIAEETSGDGDAAFLEVSVGGSPVAQFTGAGTDQAESDYYEGFVDAVATPTGIWLAAAHGGPPPGETDGGNYEYLPSRLWLWHLPPWSYA